MFKPNSIKHLIIKNTYQVKKNPWPIVNSSSNIGVFIHFFINSIIFFFLFIGNDSIKDLSSISIL